MSDPVVLIGIDWETRELAVVGLYEDIGAVQRAIGLDLPTGVNYAVMTPKLGSYVQPKPYPDMKREIVG
jgi:hypothetical protein